MTESERIAFDRTLGERIASRRELIGITQQELADSAGMRRADLDGIERGERAAGAGELAQIAWQLDLHPAELFPAPATVH
jgi:transcriptional regulator with XRE-family HTH domain